MSDAGPYGDRDVGRVEGAMESGDRAGTGEGYGTANGVATMRESREGRVEEASVRSGRPAVPRAEPIAIIGVGCHLPGDARTPERFWRLLRDGVDAVTEIPRDRFDIDPFYDPEPGKPGKTHTRYGAFVEGITDFDPIFAGVAPKNAVSIDPQQRLFLAVCWAALENAGIPPLGLDGTLTGVFAGLWSVEYWHRLASRPIEELDGNVVGGNLHCMTSGTISYLLGLRGPSLTLDTACSSSLVAVDLAVQSLRSGGSDLALAGGANVLLGPENYVCFSGMHVLSPDGRCKAFDASADGFGRGEGAGAVVLKRLSDALRDGDRVLAVIHGSATTQDGKTAGIAVPNGEAQEDAARRALLQAAIAPADVDYVEAHGTGTPVGDPIEARAMGTVYGQGRPKDRPVLIGAAKTNIAHLESAAGVASLIKVVLALQHEALPKNLHFERPNPAIPWDEMSIKVVTELTPWPRRERPRFAAVSSFGVSGTNAHLVVGEAPPVPPPARVHPERPRHVLVLSTKDKEALRRMAEEWAARFEEEPEMGAADACFSAATGRSAFRERLAVVGDSTAALAERLRSFAEGQPSTSLVTGKAPASGRPKIGFLFTGQGSQYVQMGRGLYDTQPAFRRAMDRCDEILRAVMGRSILEVIYPAPGAASPIDDTTFAQPALFALEYAACEMWKGWGILPDFVIGHSAGEDVAACVAGVFGLEDGLRLIAERGRLMGALPREGRMIAIMTNEDRVRAAVEPFPGEVSIATLNGPENVVISGRTARVEDVARAFEAQGVETRGLNTSHAFHSPLMDPMLDEFREVARSIRYAKARIPLVSNLTGALAGEELSGPDHWVTHIQKPVRFADGIAALHRLGCDVFVEVGPKPTLARISQACLPAGSGTFLPTLHPGHDDWERTLLTLGELFVRGADVDWRAFDAGYGRRLVSLPTYPVRGQRYFVDAPKDGFRADGSWLSGLLAARQDGRVAEEISRSGRFSADEARLLSRLLEVFADEYETRSAKPKSVVADYYNAIPGAARMLDGGSKEDQAERYLTFGPFHEVLPGFSWVRTFAEPEKHAEHAVLCFEAQKEMREALFRRVDLSACRSVLDFGCGYSSDLVALAQKHPHLRLTGYTIAAEQARIGAEKVKRLGLAERIQVLNRDSARDEFPGTHDLVFGFEVAHHVPDKKALFGNIGRHLRDGGALVLADFISRAGFSIDHETTSSFFITKEEWSDLLSRNGIEVEDCVDISQEIANFLHDPDFDATIAGISAFKQDPNILAGFKSYDQLGKLLRRRLTDYVLLTARKRPGVPADDLRRRNLDVLAAPVPYASVALAGGCYDVRWKAAPAPAAASNGHPRRVLVLADRGGVGQALADRLAAGGARCTVAVRGARLARAGEGRFSVDPANPEDLRTLLDQAGAGEGPHSVVHLWGLDAPAADDLTPEGLDEAQVLGCESVLGLVQAMAGVGSASKPRLWLVTRRAQAVADEPVEIAQAPLLGLGKSVLLEHPELWGGMVDLDAGDPGESAAVLASELAAPTTEYHVAHRKGARLAARLARRRPPAAARPTVRGDASYVVTGGTGALGLRTAAWLADEGARHLVLASRRPPGAEAEAAIAALQGRGVVVRVRQADVAQPEQAALLVEEAATLAPLRGVVHAAGVLDDGVLLQQTAERLRRVLAPKVRGAFNLHQATKGHDLDFFVAFSSAAALLGSAGQSSYAAGNAFLDALAERRRASGLPALSVSWGAWAGSGMAASLSAAQRKSLAERGVGDIEPAEGLRMLGSLIAEGRGRTGVCPMDWTRYFVGTAREAVLPYFEGVAPAADLDVPAPAAAGGDLLAAVRRAQGEDRRNLLGRYLQERVALVLGYKSPGQIDRDLTLLELGFDSLMAVQLRNHIRHSLEVDVPIGKLFDSTSVDGLTHLVQERLAAESSSPREQVEVI